MWGELFFVLAVGVLVLDAVRESLENVSQADHTNGAGGVRLHNIHLYKASKKKRKQKEKQTKKEKKRSVVIF